MANITKRSDGRWRARYRDAAGDLMASAWPAADLVRTRSTL